MASDWKSESQSSEMDSRTVTTCGITTLNTKPTRDRALIACLVGGLLLVAGIRWLTVFTEAVNWDEFTLLERAERGLVFGEVMGGGRPGLAAVVVSWFMRGCIDAVSAAVNARMLWQLFNLAYVVGTWWLVVRWFRFAHRSESGLLQGATAAAFVAFLPAFVVWSVQVRTDQIALAAGVWAGCFILSERRLHSVLAGALAGVALLATQKALYPAALSGLLWFSAVAYRLTKQPKDPIREEITARLIQAGIALATLLAALALYALLVPKVLTLASSDSVVSAWGEMRHARARLGLRAYVAAAIESPMHVALLAGSLFASLALLRRRTPEAYHLAISWFAVTALGAGVVAAHGSSYPYFLMTATLFPAVAIGMVSGVMFEALGSNRRRYAVATAIVLALGTVRMSVEMLDGDQHLQHDTVRWLRQNGLSAGSGFQVDGALRCDRERVAPRSMSHKLNLGPLSAGAAQAFIDEFRDRPVVFLIDADRLRQFPNSVRRFWAEHYQWYHGAVWIAGFSINTEPGPHRIDVLVPGTYRWAPKGRNDAATLSIGDRTYPVGARISLEKGVYVAAIKPVGLGGSLVFDVPSHPGHESYTFIDFRQLDRLDSVR